MHAEVDPIDLALDAWNEARQAYELALRTRDAAAEALARAKQALADAEGEVDAAAVRDGVALDALINTIPTTRTGLLRYVEAMASDDGFRHGAFRTGSDFDTICAHIIRSLQTHSA